MSRNLIDEIYDCEVFGTVKTDNASAEYKAVLDRLIKAETALKTKFPECIELFEEYQNADIDLHNLSDRNEFTTGFRAGARLMLDLLVSTEKGQ